MEEFEGGGGFGWVVWLYEYECGGLNVLYLDWTTGLLPVWVDSSQYTMGT